MCPRFMNLNPKTFGHASAVNRAGEIRTCIRGVESERGRAGGREGGRDGKGKEGQTLESEGRRGVRKSRFACIGEGPGQARSHRHNST